MLHGVDGATIVGRDLRDPAALPGSTRAFGAHGFDEPIAVLLVAILHCRPDNADDPARIAAAA